MSDQFVAEIRAFGFNFAPVGWAQCNGQLLPISQNTALFSLIGTFYGGNGTSNFALPNLQGNAPLDQGSGPGLTPFNIGDSGGETTVTLTLAQLPAHTHTVQGFAGRGGSTTASPQSGGSLSVATGGEPYLDSPTGLQSLAAATVTPVVGGGQPHNNVMPSLALNFCIALQGIFPARFLTTAPGAVSLRPAMAEDEQFLRALHATTRQAELDVLGWSGAAAAAFLEMQFAAQDGAYRAHHPAAAFDLVLVDGEPAGRLTVDREREVIHVVEIVLLPQHRGRGIGTALLEELLQEGRRSGRPVQLSALRTNPALALYRRLGFAIVGGDEVYVELHYEPDGPAGPSPAVGAG